MALEAKPVFPAGEVKHTLTGTIASGEIRRLPNGRAAYLSGASSAVSGDAGAFISEGVVKVVKSTSVVFVPGQEVWYDPGNDYATYSTAGRAAAGFFLGTCVDQDTVAAATTTVTVDLNKRHTSPHWSLADGGGICVPVGTTMIHQSHAGCWYGELTATSEAQKVDLLGQTSITIAGSAILEFEVIAVANGSDNTVDANFGLANATHASNADTITESVFIHIDGNDTKIYAESDDGTTEVAATDTTKTLTAGTPFHVVMDVRTRTDIQIYINGALILGTTIFTLGNGTGPMKFLAHVEKSASTATGAYMVRFARMWASKSV